MTDTRVQILTVSAVVQSIQLKNICWAQLCNLSKQKQRILDRQHCRPFILAKSIVSIMHDTRKIIRSSKEVQILLFVAVKIMYLPCVKRMVLKSSHGTPKLFNVFCQRGADGSNLSRSLCVWLHYTSFPLRIVSVAAVLKAPKPANKCRLKAQVQ